MTDRINVALSVDALGPRLTGIGRYCLELLRGLRGHAGVGTMRFFVGADWLDEPEARLAEDWHPTRPPRWRRGFDDWRRKKWAASALVHGPNYFLPEWAERGVVTVHDLSVLLYPETHPVERVRDFERRLQPSLDRATAIITDSQAVRSELMAYLGLASERIHAVPLGVRLPAGTDLTMLPPGLVPGDYCLCVSTFEPRKRIEHLVAAYARLPAKLRAAVPLVLAGAGGWRNEALNAAIAAAQAQGWLRRLDFVPDTQLDALYAGARLFIYPSRYEGFGLPPIEAMARGVPTMVGDAATLIEVTRGAARVVNPDNEDDFVAALAEALEDHTWRTNAAATGRAVAASYRWNDTINDTVAVYRAATQV